MAHIRLYSLEKRLGNNAGYKEENTTTKKSRAQRILTNNFGKSLNDTLLIGPKISDEMENMQIYHSDSRRHGRNAETTPHNPIRSELSTDYVTKSSPQNRLNTTDWERLGMDPPVLHF